MPWKLSESKEPKSAQEHRVKQLLKEMAEYTYATYAESFESAFKSHLPDIKRTNNFSADLMFKVTHRNQKSVEVWKMHANGDFNYKMWQLDYFE